MTRYSSAFWRTMTGYSSGFWRTMTRYSSGFWRTMTRYVYGPARTKPNLMLFLRCFLSAWQGRQQLASSMSNFSKHKHCGIRVYQLCGCPLYET